MICYDMFDRKLEKLCHSILYDVILHYIIIIIYYVPAFCRLTAEEHATVAGGSSLESYDSMPRAQAGAILKP